MNTDPSTTFRASVDSAPIQAALGSLSVPRSVLTLIPYHLAVEYFVLPVSVDPKGRIQALMAYPSDARTLQCIQMHTGVCVKPVPAAKDDVLRLITKFYGEHSMIAAAGSRPSEAEVAHSRRLAFSASQTTIAVVDDILHEAIRLRASDIHMEPFEREMCVRFRIDGVLQEMMSIPAVRVREVTSRVKIMSNMDIAERRRAQDGRIRITDHGADVDVRVSSLPTDFGEKMVLRLLDKRAFDYSLEGLGMPVNRLAMFRKAIQMPNGIILLTGPTGSGKTTTLYAAMNYLKKPGVNISTVEDPIEYNIPGVNQTQINIATGMTFAKSLRTLLRQDPDIIMVGEMRDQETAEIAIRASLTGHLVLSTLHTNDAPSAATRLIDMGIEPYMVSSSISMIVAQRLVRRICEHCKCEDIATEEIKESIGLPKDIKLYKGLGCSRCGHTGYKGRTGIYEVLPISDTIRKLIVQKAITADVRNQALKEGMVTLRDHGLSELMSGTTSVEEVMREIAVLA